MQEPWVWSLGQKDPLVEEMENLMNRGAWWAIVHGVAKSWTLLKQHMHTHCGHSSKSVTSKYEYTRDYKSSKLCTT